MNNTDDDPDSARLVLPLPAGHLALRRRSFLSAIPAPGQGDARLARLREYALATPVEKRRIADPLDPPPDDAA
jgi:hypothetical protein